MAKTKKREDQRYEKKITVGRNADGSLRRISVYGTTKKELERKVAEIETDLERGIFLSTETVTFGAVAENWITFFKPLISEKMRLRYKGIIDGHLKPLEEMKVKDRENVTKYIENTLNTSLDQSVREKYLYVKSWMDYYYQQEKMK